ncbi:MAG: APC family permease [Candidatus Spechtbacterales bacterium]
MKNVEFKLVLGLWMTVLALGVGSLIGGGLFGLTGYAVGYAGPSFLLVIALLALLNFVTVMTYAELALAIPDAGGGYVWIKMAFGHSSGHIAGWASWGAHMVASSVYALNIGYYAVAILTHYIIPDTALWGGNYSWIIGIAIVFIIIWCIINILGTSQSGRFGMYLVLAVLGAIGLYVILGAVTIFMNAPASRENFTELFPKGTWGLITAMGIFSLAFQGSEIVAQGVKELKNPKKDLKRALFYSYGIIVAIYLLVVGVAIAGVHSDVASWVVLADAKEGAIAKSASFFVFGSMLVVLVLVAGFVASIAALNSTIFSASHTAKALGDAKSLPYPFRILLEKRNSPVFAIVVSAFCMIFMVIVLPMEGVAAVANLLFILLFLALNCAVIKLRIDRPEIARPYKVPLFPLLNLGAIAGYIIVMIPLFSVSAWGVTIFVIWFFFGMLVWFLFAKKNIEEEVDSAIIYEEYHPFGSQTYAKVFCPIMEGTNWKALLEIAHAIARDRNTAMYFCLLQELPKGVSSFKEFDAADARKFEMMERGSEFCDALISKYKEFSERVSLRLASAAVSDSPPSFEQLERFGYAQIIRGLVEKIDADVLILPFEQIEFLRRGFGWATLTRLLRQTRCNLMVVKIGTRASEGKFLDRCLVPYVSNPHGGLLFDTIRALREHIGSSFYVRFLHLKEAIHSQEKIRKVQRELDKRGFYSSDLLDVQDVAGDRSLYIAEKAGAGEYNLVLMAASKDHWLHEMKFGNVVEGVMRNLGTTTIVMHRHQEPWHPFVVPFVRLYHRLFADSGNS